MFFFAASSFTYLQVHLGKNNYFVNFTFIQVLVGKNIYFVKLKAFNQLLVSMALYMKTSI